MSSPFNPWAFHARLSGSQDHLNMPTAPSPLPAVHEHAATSFLFSSNGSNKLSHTSNTIPKPVSLHLLETITNDFSEERELGSGAYGKVYKGVHENGETIAVKLLRSNPGFDDTLFEKEFRNAARLYHENIVRLLGFCYETRREFVLYNEEMIFAESTRMALCFEFMHNGSLENYIFDECSGLDWPKRYAIIKGICEGLEYLHEELEPPLYHLDLKPSNILLDVNMMPKLADFGTSGIFGQEQTQITGSCIGTIGYMSPEYIDRQIISNKFDIFSLGVIIIKLITGPTGYTQCDEMPSEQFIELVHEKWRNRLQATSEDRMEQYSEQLMRCIEMALCCVEKEWHKRPRIGDIIDKLNEMEAKDQGYLDQVSAQASLLPAASSCTPQERTNTKGVSRSREHARTAMTDLVEKLQSLLMEEAKLQQRMWADLAFISGELQVIQSILYNIDEGKLVRNVVVRTRVSQVHELANEVGQISFLRKIQNCRHVLQVSRLQDESAILGSGRRNQGINHGRRRSRNGSRRTRKEMPPSIGRRRSPACLHAWRCQQPR